MRTLLVTLLLFAAPAFAQSRDSISASRAALSSVAASTSSQAAFSARPARKGMVLVNDSAANAYVAFAASATTSAYTLKMAAGSTWIMEAPVYSGQGSVIYDAANGALKVTDLY
jgi:hypothetical protein